MRREKSLLLGFARALAGEAVHVMMAVALDVRYPEKADERQILLQREPGGGGEILAGEKAARRAAGRVPLSTARGVEHRFVESLARLARHAGVAKHTCPRECVERGVGLVDQDRCQSRE